MDVVSHLLFGRALAALAAKPARGLTAAVVIGSIAPDIDALLMPAGWDRYLLWHQRGTHALAGTLIVATALALLLRALLRVPWPRGATPDRAVGAVAGERAAPADGRAPDTRPPGARSQPGTHLRPAFGELFLASWLGCLGHLTLDLVSGGTIRLFAPFDLAPFGVPWTAMADPLLAVPLAVFFLASLCWRRHIRRLALLTMVILAGVIGLKEVSRRRAVTAYEGAVAASAAESTSAVASTVPDGATSGPATSEPTASRGPAFDAAWASPTRWWAFDRAGPLLRTWEIDAWTGLVRLDSTRDTTVPATTATAPTAAPAAGPPGGPPAQRPPVAISTLLDASRRLDTVRHLHQLFDLTFAEVRVQDDRTEVRWADIRFCGPTRCDLWFGGTFDPTGRPLEQFVLVGTFRQSRSP